MPDTVHHWYGDLWFARIFWVVDDDIPHLFWKSGGAQPFFLKSAGAIAPPAPPSVPPLTVLLVYIIIATSMYGCAGEEVFSRCSVLSSIPAKDKLAPGYYHRLVALIVARRVPWTAWYTHCILCFFVFFFDYPIEWGQFCSDWKLRCLHGAASEDRTQEVPVAGSRRQAIQWNVQLEPQRECKS